MRALPVPMGCPGIARGAIARKRLVACWAGLKAVRVERSVRPASPRTKDLATRLMMAPGLSAPGPEARAVVVGGGALPVIDTLKYLGVKDILAADLSPEFLQVVTTAHGAPGPLGNDLAVRTWCGDITTLPPYQGPADVVVFTDEPFGTEGTPRDALVAACLMLRPGGCVIIHSEMDSRRWQPKFPPTREALAALAAGLPLQVHSEQEVTAGYCGVLQVPPFYRLRAPFPLAGPVVRGFGRGSRQLGTPTANIDTGALEGRALADLAPGVYYGWARVDVPEGWPAEDAAVHKAVLNVGSRPTVNAGGEAASVEVHLLHTFKGGEEFYGSHMQVSVLGFIRPEIRFPSLDALTARIRADTAIARNMLEAPELRRAAAALEPAAQPAE